MSEIGRDYPVVMRMQGMWPKDMGGYEGHRTRKGGDLGHVDRSRSHLNGPPLIGSTTWAQEVHDEISEMRLENHADELEKLEKRRRMSEIAQRMAEGPRDPWRATRHGPLREVILTANAEWFADDLTEFLGESGPTREHQFETLAIEWLKTEFGEDCVHARADRDERAYHIHAVIVPRTKTKDGRRMLQPSKHPAIRDYEDGQDSVGAWFEAARIGLTRGERRKQKIRDALDHNAEVRKAHAETTPSAVLEGLVPVPEHRRHVSPRKWREDRERVLSDRQTEVAGREADAETRERDLDGREVVLDDRKTAVDRKERDADAVLEIARSVAEGRVDVTGNDDEPEEVSPPSSDRAGRASLATHLFGRALRNLRKAARSEAHAELATAFAEIRAADDAIVAVARAMPEGARHAVATARVSLTGRIMTVSKMAKGWLGRDREDEPGG